MNTDELKRTTVNSNSEKETLVDKISNLENYFADNLLSEELKLIYAQIQLNCNEFRENVFFKNISLIEQNAGKTKTTIMANRKESDQEHLKRLMEIKSYDEMLKQYSS